MENHESEQQAPSAPRLKLPHHDRPGIVNKEVSEKSPLVSQSHVQPRRKGVISPPPLKRQRTTSDKPSSMIRKAGLQTDPSAITHSFNGRIGATSTAQSNQKPETMSVSISFPAPSAPQRQDNRNTRDVSGRCHVSHPRKPLSSTSLPKATCLICDKSSATSYNPIVACSGCFRSYHDSCRKPPLAPGINPQQWQCSACLSDTGTRKSSSVSLAPAPASHSVVRELLKPRFAHRAPNAVPSDRVPDRVPEAMPEKRLEPEIALTSPSAAASVNLNKPKDVLFPSKSLEPKLLERTEVPNTPSQRSSQFDSSIPEKPSDHLPNARVSQQNSSAQGDGDISALDESSHTQKRTPSTALCSTCRKQTGSVKPGEEGAQCSGCRTRLRIAEMGKQEIPETPNVDTASRNESFLPTTSSNSITHSSAPILDDHEVGTVPSMHVSPVSEAEPGSITANASSLSWFDPDRAKIRPRMKKPRDDDLPGLYTADIRALDALVTSQITSLEQRPSVLGEDESPKSASTLPGFVEVVTHILPKHLATKSLPDRAAAVVTKEEESAIPKSDEKVESGPLPDPNISDSSPGAYKGPSRPTERHTNRELARIALVCAKGTGMTALQMIDWLALRFSYLKKGQGAWEKSLKSVLSLKPEFHGVKPPGRPHESRVVYNFTSTASRAKYEKEYHDYLPLASVPGPQNSHQRARKGVPQRAVADNVTQHEEVQDEQPTLTRRTMTKAIKSAPSRRNAITHDSLPTPLIEEVTTDAEPGFNPFERATVSRLTRAPFDDLDAQRGTDFRSAYSPNTASSIDFMTPEEKATKIAEIKARPSRKHFFGANWRLAHVRRFGREDIHDESDGAWKSHNTTEKSIADRSSAMNDRDVNQSLLQVFNLPTNTRPFSDGNELVFRDATLVNGRLPRSRQAYRVGKVFGGELTIN